MAKGPPDKTARDTNLDNLKKAVNKWIDKEITRLDNEAKFMRSVLKGRGASDTAAKNLNSAVSAMKDDIDAYLTGAEKASSGG